MKKHWYEHWFDSEYYHLLYKHRDEQEAEQFVGHLADFLKLIAGSSVLDMPCGKGRHSVFLEKKGYDVTGIDLSPQSIAFAKKYENEQLSFYVHDMRRVFRVNYYDAVLNLFTSIGYFENEKDNLAVVNSAAIALKPGGYFVLDFMNVKKTLKNIIKEETKLIDGISFRIKRSLEDNRIIKKINFSCSGEEHSYCEQVQALTLKDFQSYFQSCNLKILHLFGDYTLKAFDENDSERLIIIAQK